MPTPIPARKAPPIVGPYDRLAPGAHAGAAVAMDATLAQALPEIEALVRRS